MGGSIIIPGDGLPPAEAKGAGGALFTFFYLCFGIGILKSLWNRSGNRDKICSRPGLLEESPYFRWWRNEEDWYSEYNPMMKVTYPENHICPYARKK